MITINRDLEQLVDRNALQEILDRKMLFFNGEYYLQIELGIDYLSQNTTVIRTQIEEQILDTEGVLSVIDPVVEKKGNKIYVSLDLNTIYGEMNVTNS